MGAVCRSQVESRESFIIIWCVCLSLCKNILHYYRKSKMVPYYYLPCSVIRIGLRTQHNVFETRRVCIDFNKKKDGKINFQWIIERNQSHLLTVWVWWRWAAINKIRLFEIDCIDSIGVAFRFVGDARSSITSARNYYWTRTPYQKVAHSIVHERQVVARIEFHKLSNDSKWNSTSGDERERPWKCNFSKLCACVKWKLMCYRCMRNGSIYTHITFEMTRMQSKGRDI